MSYIQYIDPPYVRYVCIARTSNKTYWRLARQMFTISRLWDNYKKEKYYKGTDSTLYFPYIPNNKHLKEVPHVNIPYYYGLKADKVIFDDILGPIFKEDKNE